MQQKIDRYGRVAALVSSMVLCALLFNIWALNATAVEQRDPALGQPVGFQESENQSGRWLQDAYESFLFRQTNAEAVPAAQVKEELAVTVRNGRPVAYVNIDKLYLVTRSGKIIGPADSCEHYDVPIISNRSFMVDEKRKMLVDEGTRNALRLLADMQGNYAIKSLLSEIKVTEDGEIIAYMNMGKVMPVLFGNGAWDEKIQNFVSYEKQLGGTSLNRQALYLDLRVEDRVIVKKNT